MPHQRKPKASPPTATPSASALTSVTRADQELLARAVRKMVAREELSRREREVLNRHEKEQEKKRRWQYYETISQKDWKEMSGRQAKVINEQAARYGIPFGGAIVNLRAVVRAMHDFLADNASKLAKDDDALMLSGGSSPALERYREERAAIARLDRLEREAALLPRDEVREAMGRIANILKGAGETLQRQFGPAAMDILTESLDDAEREMERSFGVQTSDGGNAETTSPDQG